MTRATLLGGSQSAPPNNAGRMMQSSESKEKDMSAEIVILGMGVIIIALGAGLGGVIAGVKLTGDRRERGYRYHE